jgi:general secretion pathway protein F/type IV pilus assembly protein PilC
MPDFDYIARDLSGQQVSGSIAAATQREALSQLASKSLFPIRVNQQQAIKRTSLRGRRVSGQLLSNFYNQLASLLRSGVPLLRSLAILRDQTSHARLSQIISDVHLRVEDGANLADAMARHTHVFKDISVSLVRAGIEGGFLEDSLDRIAVFTEQQEDLKGRTMGALAYPIFLAVFGSLVVMVLLVFFVPSFEEIFGRLRERGELPVATEMLLAVSHSLRSWWMVIAAAMAGLVYLIRKQVATERGQWFVDRWKLKIPSLGVIFQNLAVARICRVLGTLLHNGVPILRSLEITQQAAGNKVLAAVLEEAAQNVSEGEPLATPLARSPNFPREIVEMISVAEESNTMEKVLVDIADRLEKRTSRRLELFVRLLEPLLLVCLAAVVMLVVIALLLPIMKMSSTL